MDRSPGFLIVFDSLKQVDVFNTYLENSWLYSDIVSDVDFPIKTSELALISLDKSTISHVCLLRRKKGRVATRKCRLDFTDITKLESPLKLEEILLNLPSKNAFHLRKSSAGGIKRITIGTWKALLNFFQKKYKEAFAKIVELNKLRTFKPEVYSRRGIEILVQEKDAVNLALRFANFSSEPIRHWVPTDTLAPFLKGLHNVNITEDSMIIHDSSVFKGWVPQKHDQLGTVSFTNDKGEVIQIWNVNRTPIERTLGVDLIYYHHKFNSYVLVQYKRMEKEEVKTIFGLDEVPDGYVEWVYRPIDKSYSEEIKRMREFERIAIREEDPTLLIDYRFNDDAFYFKLCPAESINPTSSEMIRGMYLPLSYWERLLSSPDTTGPKGGKYVSYKNASRYFTNTVFIELVQAGWIGTRNITSIQLNDLIQNILESGKSLVLAEVHKLGAEE